MRRQVLSLAIVALSASLSSAQVAPVADHHQHLFSPAIAELLSPGSGSTGISARDLVALLDAAGIRSAIVLSVAYMYGSPFRTVADEYAKVRAENDWTGAEAAQYPERLRTFRSVSARARARRWTSTSRTATCTTSSACSPTSRA